MKIPLFVLMLAAQIVIAQQEIDFKKKFGKTGLQLEDKKIDDIFQLFQKLTQANQTIMSDAAIIAKNTLEKEFAQLKKRILQMQEQNEIVPQELFLNDFALEQQIKHFEHFLKFNQPASSFISTAKNITAHFFGNLSPKMMALHGTKEEQSEAQSLASLIMNYIRIERDYILMNYDQLLMFLLLRAKMKLPQIIDFWNNPDLQDRLKKRAKKIAPPQVQWVEMVVNIALQAIILAGGSLAMQWEDADAQKEFEQYQTQQNQIASDWQTFQKNLVDNQKSIMRSIAAAFTKSSQAINEEYKKNSQQLQEEILYLNRSINLDTPIIQALSSPITWDQYFENSVMNTPSNSLQWYNIYQVAQGDWQFDPVRNSFWQNGLAPFPKTSYWMKVPGTGSIFTDDPAANSIFTEYATSALTYDIEIEVNLVNVSYPFFVGVIFNRGHWISGDPERIWQYRLAGFYGTQATLNDPKSQAVNFCFAQQIIKKKTKNELESIVAPLQQIYQNPKTHLYKLDNKETESLQHNPTTFILSITTSPTIVSCSITKKGADQQPKQLFSKTVSDLDSYLFMFSGIGFIASGCQAEFKITKPTDLQYSQQQLNQFAAQISPLRK
jgi:hypothetical protein